MGLDPSPSTWGLGARGGGGVVMLLFIALFIVLYVRLYWRIVRFRGPGWMRGVARVLMGGSGR